MLRLDAMPQVWVTHEETGAEFEIRPLDPKDNQKLVKRARDKKGDFDGLVYNGLVVDYVVLNWRGIGGATGELPASTENKVRTGERFPKIANWLHEQATDIKLFVEEMEDGKND